MVSVVKVLVYRKGGVMDLSAFSDRPTAEQWSLLPKKGSEKKNEIQGDRGMASYLDRNLLPQRIHNYRVSPRCSADCQSPR